MAKKVKKKNIKQTKKVRISPFSIYWEKKNYLFFAGGMIVIMLGFYFLSIGPWDSFSSLVISPILLFIGYILVFPASIFFRKKSGKNIKEDKVAAGES